MSSKRREQRDQRGNVLVRGVRTAIAELAGRGRLPAVAVLLLVSILGGLYSAWRHVGPSVIAREEYRVTADRIVMTPPPDWLSADVADEVFRDGSLDTGLSILDDDLAVRLIDAFEIHPWIRSVDRVQKRFPAGVEIAVTFREPVAAVVVTGRGGDFLSPVDADGIRLPASDMRGTAARLLPRIGPVTGPPQIGQPWREERVLGGCRLALFLADDWKRLCLVDIRPSERSDSYKKKPYFVYQLVTRGGTRIVWGAAPESGPPDESTPEEKLARLCKYVDKNGALSSIKSPMIVDVRHGLEITPWSARNIDGHDGDVSVQ